MRESESERERQREKERDFYPICNMLDNIHVMPLMFAPLVRSALLGDTMVRERGWVKEKLMFYHSYVYPAGEH